jgi:hypothetical protein
MKGVLPWLVRLVCQSQTGDFCSALADLVGPVRKIFLSYKPIGRRVGAVDPSTQ